nr:hypothetical protein [Tanacetum cinerariifolium]
MKRQIDELEKTQNISLEQTDRTDPPPPQAQTKHVNAVFTGSGESDDSPKTQKDPLPPIIVNNKIEIDNPIKASKGLSCCRNKRVSITCVSQKPARDYNSSTRDTKRFKGLLNTLNATSMPTKLHTTSNFKADHVNAFDPDSDDEATASAIFMASLSPARSINGDTVGPTYDSNILYDIPNYDIYHETYMLHSSVQETNYYKHLVFSNESYEELTCESNVISYVEYMVTIKNDGAQSIPTPQ